MFFPRAERCQVPGRHITDHQMELYMTYRKGDPAVLASAKAASEAWSGVGERARTRLG